MGILWPVVEVNGVQVKSGGGTDGILVTPEHLAQWLSSTDRPGGYGEGDVTLRISYTELSRLFGKVSVSFGEEPE